MIPNDGSFDRNSGTWQWTMNLKMLHSDSQTHLFLILVPLLVIRSVESTFLCWSVICDVVLNAFFLLSCLSYYVTMPIPHWAAYVILTIQTLNTFFALLLRSQTLIRQNESTEWLAILWWFIWVCFMQIIALVFSSIYCTV